MGPVPAVRKVLERAGLKLDEIDVFEVNEAFAAQALAVVRELGLPPDRTNPNGSGISLGHPIGATGAILAVKALYELRRTGGQLRAGHHVHRRRPGHRRDLREGMSSPSTGEASHHREPPGAREHTRRIGGASARMQVRWRPREAEPMFAQLDPADFGSSLLSVLGRAAGAAGRGRRGRACGSAQPWPRIWPVAAARWLGSEAEPPVPVRRQGQAVRRPGVGRQPRLLRAAAGVPGRPAAGRRPAGRRAGRPGGRPEGTAGRRLRLGRPGPDELPAHQPGRAEAGVRDRRRQRARRAPATSSTTLRTTAGGRARSTRSRSSWAANLAATPGKVVFRNELMELIQYAPQTKQVRSVPLLASPPWINKYYIMDLAPGRSFIEWAVQHRRTVFAISYRNPDASMSGVTLDDYLIHGPKTALDVISDITGSAEDRHRRAVPRRRPDRDARRLPRRDRRRPDRLGHAAQHPARLQRAGRARRLHRRADRRTAGAADGARPGVMEGSRWPARSTCCGPTT